jgi:hypothetical protein
MAPVSAASMSSMTAIVGVMRVAAAANLGVEGFKVRGF